MNERGSLVQDPEAVLMRVAARQSSVFARGQALAAGITQGTIKRRLTRGRWVRLHQGVYAPASIQIGWPQSVAAAQLACGPDSVVSFRSASAVWGLRDDVGAPEVTVLHARIHRRPGIVVHRSQKLEATSHRGFRVTTPMRTLLDLAGCEPDETLECHVDAAFRRRLIGLERLADYLASPFARSRRCADVLREIVAARDPRRPIESELETLLFSALRRARLPLATPQFWIRTRMGRRRIDYAYPGHMLAIELDSWMEHGSRVAFESDRARQNELEELGWHFRRFTWRQLRTNPTDIALTVGIALGLYPSRWRATAGPNRTTRSR